MMSPTATKSRSSHRGFTLVEMLVVIGIIVLLIGILLPAINVAYTHAIRNRMALDIQSISTALEAYKSDARSYPKLDYGDTGTGGIMTAAYPASVLLCRCLIGPGKLADDGADGPGFRQIPNGQVYGPYLEVGRFKMVADPGITGGSAVNNYFIADRYSHPILYFLANPGADPSSPNGYVNYTKTAPFPMYNLYDDQGSSANPALVWSTTPADTAANALKRMRLMLGDQDANGQINDSEQAFTKHPYLLWCAGPDEVFGIDLSGTGKNNATPASNATLASRVPGVDDATNFTQ